MAVTTSDLRDMGSEELLTHIADTRRELFGLRFSHATGELEDTSGLSRTKRELARSLTIARERGIDVHVNRPTSAPH
jgi:large subunit ribosomal protein L29